MADTFTYDVDDNTGKLRLAIADIDLTTTTGVRSTWTCLFTDEELAIFLSQASSNIFMAASYALNSIAASRSMLAKVLRLGDFSEDLSKLADSLRAQAKVYADMAVSIPAGAWAETTQTDFSYYAIAQNYNMRSG